MKPYVKMPPGLRQAFTAELKMFERERARGNARQAWRHLERAHVLGQSYPVEHTRVHWRMLRFALHANSPREAAGQVLRLLTGGVKSVVGRVPIGNTGGANVPPLRRMPLPEDLRAVLAANGAPVA